MPPSLHVDGLGKGTFTVTNSREKRRERERESEGKEPVTPETAAITFYSTRFRDRWQVRARKAEAAGAHVVGHELWGSKHVERGSL